MVVKITTGHRGNLAGLAEAEAIDRENGVVSLHGSEMDGESITTTVVLGQSTTGSSTLASSTNLSSQANGVTAMDQSDDEHGDASDESDSMDFDDDDDDDDGSDLVSNATLGDDITAQLAAAGWISD